MFRVRNGAVCQPKTFGSGFPLPHPEGCYPRSDLTIGLLLRKEVIQPLVPQRLPCYDFIPVTYHTLGAFLPYRVGSTISGATDFHDVTGGVYKTRERIQGVVADTPLLAIPTSWSRVSDSNPNWGQL